MPHRVFIDGAEGTTGLRLAARLAEAGDIELIRVPEARRKSLPHRLAAAAEAEVTVLCLPDEAAREMAAALPGAVRLIDASTAHRTQPGWVYGFPELGGRHRSIAGAGRVAVPGCHATGFLALATPLVERGLLPPDASLCCHSLTGYSGGGKKMIAAYEAQARSPAYGAPRPYALGMAHKHLPEMQAHAGLASPPAFCPIVDDFYSGLLVSLPLPAALLPAPLRSPESLAGFYAEYYAGEALVSVKVEADIEDGTLSAGALAGRDDMELYVLGNPQQLLLCAVLDNLGKGASGAALQCLNLMLGREETAGLVFANQ